MSTKRAGIPEFDKADLDEPIFVLRAQDALAPQTLNLYALQATFKGVSKEKIQSVRDVAEAMRAWQQIHPPKLPD